MLNNLLNNNSIIGSECPTPRNSTSDTSDKITTSLILRAFIIKNLIKHKTFKTYNYK